MAKKGLGRGLEHLMGQNIMDDSVDKSSATEIKIKDMKPNPYQPRKNFDVDSLNELAESIKEQGVFQPILVREGIVGYEIIAGERRTRAAKIAGLSVVPVIICDYDDQKMMEVALIENIQREDLTIVEEAKSYKMIIENLGLTQEELGKKIGKSRPHISNTLRILTLSEDILDLMDTKVLSMGHVKVLVNIEDKSKVQKIIQLILKDGLSVREVEALAKEVKSEKGKKVIKGEVQPRNKRLQNVIREKLDAKVSIKGDKKGTIEISFSSEDDLARILEKLNLI